MRNDWRNAAVTGDAPGIARLLDDGTNIDCRDRYGQTALMLAAEYGREEVASLLLERGADRDITAKFGLSAIMLATINRHEGIVRQLADAGANTRLRGTGAPGFAGKTARDLARDAGLSDLADYIAHAEDPALRDS